MDYKALPPEFLAELLAPEQFSTPPLHHQAVSIAWAMDRPDRRVVLWHDIGVGKTVAALYTHRAWRTRRHLVICPNSVVEGWAQQLDRHLPGEFYVLLKRTAEARRREVNDLRPRCTYVTNYEGLRCMFTTKTSKVVKYVEVVNGQPVAKEKTVTKTHIDREAIRRAGFDGLTLDECHCLADAESIQSRVCQALSEAAQSVVLLTGTAYKRGLEDLWGQYLALDGGRTLGASRGWFINKWFKKDFFGKPHIKPGADAEILNRVSACTLRYDREECFDLPPLTQTEWHCDPTPEQRRLWQEIADGARPKLHELEADPVAAEQVANRIAQVAGGFWLHNGEAARLEHNPKIALLDDQLDGLPDKVIIFHHYVEEGRMIGEWLAKRGHGFAECRGEAVDRPGQIKRFQEDAGCRFLVANPQSGGVGLNLQMCPMAIFYSCGNTTAVAREQAVGRIYRLGQERPTTVADAILRGSLDERRLDKARDAVERAAIILAWVRDYGVSR